MKDLPIINLGLKYDFDRKNRSYKGKHQTLPSLNLKRAKPKLLPNPSHHEHQEYGRLSLKTLACIYACLYKNDSSSNQKIPIGCLPRAFNTGFTKPSKSWILTSNNRKQPPRCVLGKRCSGNMQQIYMRTPMSKCDFNKVAKQLY